MNILLLAHFVTDFDPHGTSRFVCLARRLGREHRVELVTSDFDHRAKETRRERDFALPAKVTLLPEPGYPKNICLRRLFSHWLFARRVRAYLKGREKPDAIYCAVPSLSCAYYAARYAEKNRIPFVIDVQDLWPEAFSLAVPGAARFLLRPLSGGRNISIKAPMSSWAFPRPIAAGRPAADPDPCRACRYIWARIWPGLTAGLLLRSGGTRRNSFWPTAAPWAIAMIFPAFWRPWRF